MRVRALIASEHALLRKTLHRILAKESEPDSEPHLVAKFNGRIVFITIDEIDWVEAAANYVRVHVGDSCHLLRKPIGQLESELTPPKFLRIHRSTIINRDRIEELRRVSPDTWVAVTQSGQELRFSRRYREQLSQLLSVPGLRHARGEDVGHA